MQRCAAALGGALRMQRCAAVLGFDYKEHGVVDAIVPTKIRRGLPVRPITAVRQPPAGLGSPDLHFLRCPLPAPDGPCVLTRPLGGGWHQQQQQLNNNATLNGPPGRADSPQLLNSDLLNTPLPPPTFSFLPTPHVPAYTPRFRVFGGGGARRFVVCGRAPSLL